MRVGLVTTGFPRFEGDCSGAFVLTVARGIVEQGHRVCVLAPEPRRGGSAPRWPGIEVRWVPYARPRTLQRSFYGSGAPDNLRLRPTRWLGAAALTAALYRASRRELADCDSLLSSWCIPSGWVASKTAEGRPHLCLCHATDVRWLSKMPAGRAVARDIADGASAMWFLSEALRDRFLETAGEAVNRGDVEGEVNRFTSDGIYMWPDAPSIEGHEALRQWFEERFSKVQANVESETLEIEVCDDWAFERGTYVARIQVKGTDLIRTIRGKYLNILRRQSDGTWRIARRIRNRDHPVG